MRKISASSNAGEKIASFKLFLARLNFSEEITAAPLFLA